MSRSHFKFTSNKGGSGSGLATPCAHSSLLQRFHLGHDLSGLVFKRRTLFRIVPFRVFSGKIFEVQIPKIFIDNVFAFAEVVDSRLVSLEKRVLLRPEDKG